MPIDQAAYRRLVQGENRGVRAGIARLGLRLLSFPYAAAVMVRNLSFDAGWRKPAKVGIPVISVGNLTVGGTGKTPTVEWIANRLRGRVLRVAILSRGYGSAEGPNDEALLLEENLPDVPHLQGKDRVELARIACEELDSQVLILDDGFQHRRLHRDLDIVLLDATNLFGGGWQLPGGLLRESPRSLKRADVIILTRRDALDPSKRQEIRNRMMRIAGEKLWAEISFVPSSLQQFDEGSRPVEWLEQRRILAFCGIGNPSSFQRTLTDQNATVADFRAFPDHYGYARDDILELSRWAREHQPEAIVTTQKDLVKLRVSHLANIPLFAIRIAARIDSGRDDLEAALDQVTRL